MYIARAARRLWAAPAFTVAALLTLALGVGANVLIFSAVRGLLIEPLPFADGDRLVWVLGSSRDSGAAGEEVDYDEANLLARARAFDAVASIGARMLVREDGARRTEWYGLRVTISLASLLGVTPIHGEALSTKHIGMEPAAALLGYERWQRDFNADPSIVGRVVQFGDNKALTVVGVLPPGLEFPVGRAPASGTGSSYALGRQDFWVLAQGRADEVLDGAMIARLAPGVTPAAADAEARTMVRRRERSLSVVRVREHILGVLSPALPMLQIFAALVLLIACANLGSLVLARAAAMRTEFAVRTALGAGRQHLLRILLAESVLVSAAGGVLGLALAIGGRRLFAAAFVHQIAFLERVQIDGTALLLTLGVCALTTCVFALLPLAHVRPPAETLLEHGRGPTASRRHVRTLNMLAVSQVALSLVLLAGAALVLQSLSKVLSVDTGYDRAGVVAADVVLHEPPRVFVPFFQRLHQRLSALPGVDAVGLIQSTPLTGRWTFREPLVVEGGSREESAKVPVAGSFVAFDYFAAMGIPVLAGRAFTAHEFLAPNAPVVIINDIAARLYFPAGDAVGKRVRLFGKPREIVGVVKATRDVRLETPPEPQWYQPVFVGGSQVLVRTSGDPAALAATLRAELAAFDPRLVVRSVEPLESIVAASVFERRLAARLLTVFAALALTLALVGLYGVVSYQTVQRRREFGVRAALGAGRGALLRLALRQALLLTGVGVLIGAAGAISLGGTLERLLFGIRATDPWTLAMTALGLALCAAAAAVRPAWRAASVDPAVALRND